MPIYTVREVSGNDKPTAELEKRGLNARSVTMTSLDPLALPDYPQIAYNLYRTLLPAFMLATKNNVTLPTTRTGYKLIEKAENSIHIPNPPLCVRFTNALRAEEVESLKGMGASVMPSNTKEMYSFSGEKVTKELLGYLYRHNKKVQTTNPTPTGSVNLSTYQEMFRVMGIITWFLKTHTYPAFSGPVAEDSETGGLFDTIEGFVAIKRKATFGARVTKRVRLEELYHDDDEDMASDEVDDLAADIEAYHFGSGDEHVPKAKPSTPQEAYWGDAGSMPTLPGLSFPYFDNLLDRDMNFSSSVIREYFLLCLGDTRDEILSTYQAVKGALGSLAMTKAGYIFQHLFCGIKLSIESQSRLYPMFAEGRYIGFTLHGWYFTVSINGYKHRPLPYTELLPEVRRLDEHAVAIAEIMMKLRKMKLIETRKPMAKARLETYVPIVKRSPRQLAMLIQLHELNEGDAEEIEKLGAKLSYPQKYLDFTIENILKAIDLLVGKTWPTDDQPLYPRGGTLTINDPILSTFALFGQNGFSFRIPGGKPIPIPSSVASDTLYKPYRGKAGKEVKPNPTIVIAKRSLNICVEEWAEFLRDRRFLLKNTRDQAFKSIAFGGEKGKQFWHGIIERVGILETPAGIDVDAIPIDMGEEEIGAVGDTIDDFL